ncbi:DUF4150 domain-containing protein [Agrobacterium rosae]|uniref:DUF4150 domain-containing protein n=1 Tax=Agrobacterium rosae TaxID=1972867 RepID=UPI003BA1E981
MSISPDDYIGEPGYPAPWATSTVREGLRDTDDARIVSLSPDVCLTPIGSSVVPIPYPVVDFCGHDKNFTPSVRFKRKKAMVMRSCTTHVHGDKPGVRKGRMSGTVESICEPIEHADQVRAEGSFIIRHLDRFHMNSRNTVGEAIFVRDTKTYDRLEDDDPVPGSLRWVKGSDEGRVMSDAPDEPLVMGAQYAQALPQTAPPPRVPTGLPSPRPITVNPSPAANDNIFQKPPHHINSKLAKVGKLARLGVWARRLSVVGILSEIFIPDNDMNLSDVVPQDDFEQKIKDLFKEGVDSGHDSQEMRDWAMEQIRLHKQRKREEEERKSLPLPRTKPVRISRDEYRKKCEIDRYGRMRNICRLYGMEAHHIVPDWTLRYGARADATKRIKNLPSLNDGMSICVIGNAAMQDTEHNEAHLGDSAIEGIGRRSNPPGTALLSQVLTISTKAMVAARPDCAKEIVTKASGQFAGSDPNQLVRAVKDIRVNPLEADTIEALKSGAKSPWKKGGP